MYLNYFVVVIKIWVIKWQIIGEYAFLMSFGFENLGIGSANPSGFSKDISIMFVTF